MADQIVTIEPDPKAVGRFHLVVSSKHPPALWAGDAMKNFPPATAGLPMEKAKEYAKILEKELAARLRRLGK